MGTVSSKLIHSDTCNKCGVPYEYYKSDEHRSRRSCRKNNSSSEYHCFSYTKCIPWWA